MEIADLSILEFTDYRSYLRQVFERKRQINPRFSFRRFSTIFGFKSPNYLQMILDGRRNLSNETAAAFVTKLKLGASEQDYFLALVQGSNAKTQSEKNEAERVKLVAIRKLVSRDISMAHKEVFSKWYYLLVRELFLLPKAKGDPKWIRKMLADCITEVEAQGALELLCRCGLLTQTATGYESADPVLDSNDREMQASYLRVFHADTLRVWAENLDRLDPKEQELGVINIPIDSRKVPELRARIHAFQDEIIGWVQDEKSPDRVVQLGTYLIPF